MSPRDRTPETLTAVEFVRLQKLRQAKEQGAAADTNGAQGAPSPDNPMIATKPPTKRDRKLMEQMRESLPSLSSMESSATRDLDPYGEADQSFSILPIDEIVPYDHNPRQGPNPRYAELKESIRASGITNIISVSRRSVGDKYMPFGGGNTRLRIAKELYEAGDQRFAQLRVMVKEWPGDAEVITAHLVENELRADITFWEKAGGVHQYQLELERASGGALSAGQLNRKLKEHGLNYGVKTVQNFLFAIEELAPIGPWLKAREVNELIRPHVARLLALGARLGMTSEFRSTLKGTMQRRAAALQDVMKRNEELEADERRPAELNERDLVGEIDLEIAQLLAATPEQVEAMGAALDANPKLSADELRALPQRGAMVFQSADDSAAPATAAMGAPAPRQVPLGGMLAPVAPGASQPALPPAAPVHSSQDDPLQLALQDVYRPLGPLNQAIPIADLIFTSPVMPFGFFVEIPKEGMARIKGSDLPANLATMRGILWRFFVSLTYQIDRRVMVPLVAAWKDPGLKGLWAASFEQGEAAFNETCVKFVGCHVPDECISNAGALVAIFATPGVGEHVIAVLAAMDRIRKDFPERIPSGYQPLFEP